MEFAGIAIVGCHGRDEDAGPAQAEADVLAQVRAREGRAERGRGREREELREAGKRRPGKCPR